MAEPAARWQVREIAFPAGAAEITTLSRIDYTDAFLLVLPDPEGRTAEGWARAMLEDAPAATRAGLRRGWLALGLRLGSTEDPQRVLGWALRRSSDDHAVLGASSLFGMQAELLFMRERGALFFATALKFNNPIFRAFWAGFSHRHRRVVRHLLRECGKRTHPPSHRCAPSAVTTATPSPSQRTNET